MFFYWIRQQVRRVMRPIAVDKAVKYSSTLTRIYLFSAMTLCGICFFQWFGDRKGRSLADSAFKQTSGHYYGHRFKAQNLQIYQFTGGSLVKQGTYHYDKKAAEEESKKEFFGE